MTREDKSAWEALFEKFWADYVSKHSTNAEMFKAVCRTAFAAGYSIGYERAYNMAQLEKL